MDPAANWVSVRAALVAAAMRFLGPERERHAEALAERVLVYLGELAVAGSGVLDPNGTPEEIGERMPGDSHQLVGNPHAPILQTMIGPLEAPMDPNQNPKL